MTGARTAQERAKAPSRHYSGGLRTPEAIERVRARSAANQRALAVVARMYSDEFAATWTERGRKDSPGYQARRDAAKRAVAAAHPEDFARAFAAEKRKAGLA